MLLRQWIVNALCVGLFLLTCRAEFTPHFTKFLESKYGKEITKNLTRKDLGVLSMGSFGGTNNGSYKSTNRPVIFVHGVTQRAVVFTAHRTLFGLADYDEQDLYATSWGDGGLTLMYNVKLKCEYAKQIRQFIIAVNEYTGSKVDVIAYSMGAAVSRKAILGGSCVDTNEELGEAITKRVDTFVSLAGVVHGIEFCPSMFPGCNLLNGFACESEYLKELNSQTERYEGSSSYAVYSKDDRIVGQKCCNHQCSDLPHANATTPKSGHTHMSMFFATDDMKNGLNHV